MRCRTWVTIDSRLAACASTVGLTIMLDLHRQEGRKKDITITISCLPSEKVFFFFVKTVLPFGNNGSIWTRELGGHFRSEKGYCEGWQRMSPTLMTSPLSQRPVFIFIPTGQPVRSIRPLEAISEGSLIERR